MFFSGLVSGISSVRVLQAPVLTQGSGEHVLTAAGQQQWAARLTPFDDEFYLKATLPLPEIIPTQVL